VVALFGPFGPDGKDSGKGGASMSSTTSPVPGGVSSSTEPGTTTSAPTTSDMFDPAPASYSSGTVPVDGISSGPFGITTRGSSNWSGDFYNADIVVTLTGVEVANNALYAVVPDPSFPACWKAAYSVPSLTWEQVPTGTVLCIKTKDQRVGIVKFVWQKDREGELTKTTVSGVIWSPKR